MLDPTAIVQSAVSGIATQKVMKAMEPAVNRITGEEEETGASFEELVLGYLKAIANALNPDTKPDINEGMMLQPYPYEYVTDPWNHERAHISIFFAGQTPCRIDVPGIGTYLKTLGPGWVSCDIPGNARISTTDNTQHGVIVSYRANSIGSSL